MAHIYIGACSWSDFTRFYPDGLPANQQISYYAQRFPLVEVDATYYRLMPQRNFTLWAERTPPAFLFDVKAFRQLTWHDRDNPPDAETAAQFSASVQPLRAAEKLGALHYQFAPWFVYTVENLDYLRSLRTQQPDDPLAVELRHRSWYAPKAYAALTARLREARITLTVVDEPQVGSGSVPTVVGVTNPRLAVVRLHGRNAGTWYKRTARAAERFDYLYSADELTAWVPDIARLAEGAAVVHILFNNNYEDYALTNARQLRALLRERLPGAEVVATPQEQPAR